MPSLTFHPEFDRHLTFAGLAHCARDYKLLREVADGKRLDKPVNTSLLIGIGADKLVGELWRQTQRGGVWDTGEAWEAARATLDAEGVGNAEWAANRAAILHELTLLGRDYVDQWQGVRPWQVLHVDPVDDELQIHRLVIPLGPSRGYLTMPDMEARIGGVLTIVDRKTSKYPYNPAHWAWEPQLLTYCLAAEAHYKEPIAFQIDYMQRPSKRLQAWTVPLTYPFPFDDARRALAKSWLYDLEYRRIEYTEVADHRSEYPDEYPVEPWPRDSSACRTWYGRCQWEGECFGTADTDTNPD